MPTVDFSDYLIFADESGDHELRKIDSDYPLFVLSFCIIRRTDYVQHLSPALQQLKLDFWGHDNIILHEHDIRKEKGPFTLLRTDPDLRKRFYDRLTDIIQISRFNIVGTVIDKKTLKERYALPYSPYEIALLFCMERVLAFLLSNGQIGRKISVVFECRGSKEDNDLELEFRRICDNKSNWGYKSPDFKQIAFEPVFSQKSLNVPGLQLADMIARPLGLYRLRPNQSNRAYDVIKDKIEAVKWFP